MDKEVEKILVAVNAKLSEFKRYYPRQEWSEKTKEDLIINFIFHSNKIEGLNFSHGETMSFLRHGLIENKRLTQPEVLSDISMLNNHQKALSLIFNSYKECELSTKLISEVHTEILTTGTLRDDDFAPGHYRGDDICVKKTDGQIKYFLYDWKIPKAMEELVERTNSRIKSASFESIENHPLVIAIDLHVDFLNIHPFRDGNGRMARLLMNMVNMKFKIPPFSPKSDQESRMLYYKTFDKVDEAKNNNPMLVFMGNRLLEVMGTSISMAKEK